MDFSHSDKAEELRERLQAFMDEHIYPNEKTYKDEQAAMADRWQPVPVVERLKPVARAAGLWNLFLPESDRGAGLTNVDYAPLAEIMGRVQWSSEVFNCSAPDTGNMETIARYGTDAQKQEWLEPLLRGEIRSCFCMTEPDVASSDATNIQSTIRRDGGDYVINGRKWWSSGSGDPRCKLFIFMGKTDPDGTDKYRQQSMILVPAGTKGLTIKRMLPVFGFDDAPHGHGEIAFEDVRVPAENILLGEGRGFEISQLRLGPGRIHHCMRSIGAAERAIDMMVDRGLSREAFGKKLINLGKNMEVLSRARIDVEAMRLMVLRAAKAMDTLGNAEARVWVSAVKAMVPERCCDIIDEAIQMHGAAGISQWFPLADMWHAQRTLRLADGPDEVHHQVVARAEVSNRKAARAESPAVAREASFSGP
ncbi:MAG: acyl-CoA dehydrogenase family protein [Pseudomonadota bacterium]|nr:acyl-CoA dehydrogenase family protein [Pseudomonadota bacterium]